MTQTQTKVAKAPKAPKAPKSEPSSAASFKIAIAAGVVAGKAEKTSKDAVAKAVAAYADANDARKGYMIGHMSTSDACKTVAVAKMCFEGAGPKAEKCGAKQHRRTDEQETAKASAYRSWARGLDLLGLGAKKDARGAKKGKTRTAKKGVAKKGTVNSSKVYESADELIVETFALCNSAMLQMESQSKLLAKDGLDLEYREMMTRQSKERIAYTAKRSAARVAAK